MGPIATDDFQTFSATLLGCEGIGYSVSIAANSISDAAGNPGPTALASVSYVAPASQTSSAPGAVATTRRTPTGAASTQDLQTPKERDEADGQSRAADSELFTKPEQRDQAAQSLTVVSDSSQDNASLLGWAIGFGLTGILILAAGIYIRRKGLPEMLVS
jgi:type IV secretory pathway VirJ component